jgi:polar amino acid transport system substrate-binding protein
MKTKSFFQILLIIAFVSTGLTSCKPTAQSSTGTNNVVYDRVIKSNTIKCAFLNYPPSCMKDTKTGKMSGIFVDVLEKAANNLGMKVEWTEEVGWGSQIEGLNTDRYDLIGSPVWANPKRGKLTTLSIPVFYSGIGVYVRVNENRFSSDLSKINSKDVKVGTIDGETSDLIADNDFPNATKQSSPENTDISQKFLDLGKGSCDIVFAEPYYAYQYDKNNPGKLKNIVADKPVRLFGNVYMMKAGEWQLKQMLDVAIQDLINSGYVDKAIAKYEPAPNLFYRVALPYKPIK